MDAARETEEDIGGDEHVHGLRGTGYDATQETDERGSNHEIAAAKLVRESAE